MIIPLIALALTAAVIKNVTQMRAGLRSMLAKSPQPFWEEIDRAVIYAFYLGLWTLLLTGKRPVEDLFSVSGGILIAGGAGLSFEAIRKLGPWHSEYIAPTEGAPLAVSGVYGWMRHPMRTGFFVEVIGLVLLLQQLWAVAALGVVALLLVFRTRREERLLLRHYGIAYHTYCKRIPILPILFPRLTRLGRPDV